MQLGATTHYITLKSQNTASDASYTWPVYEAAV